MIRLTIDGKEIATEAGKTILEAAREGGISIPTLCYHEHLLPIGSCRLCVVEVEGYEKPMTACTTQALEGISVTTQSDRLHEMRREFLKLILVSHPLDCPQCDKGGECRLQNLVYEHGIETAEYKADKEDRKETYATPLIRYWQLRCVLCGRCYRACREVSGREAIDLKDSGFASRIAPLVKDDCISCGECLSLCPVGALTETLSPIKSRIWQSERTDTACPHCGFGCRLTLNVIDGQFITKVVSETDLPPNNTSLCVRGRFGYDFANNENRLTEPRQRMDCTNTPLSMEETVRRLAEHLMKLSEEGKGLGFIVSPRVTNEELFLISRIAARLKKVRIASSAFYHTGRVAAVCRQMGIKPHYSYDKLRDCETIVVAGADLLINNHLLANKVREAVKFKGARIIVVDPLPASLARIADAYLQVLPGKDAAIFNNLSLRLLADGKHAKEAQDCEGFSALRDALAVKDAAAPLADCGVSEETMEKAYGLLRDAVNVGVIFASGITGNEESLAALLNFCLLKGLHKKGLIMPAALQANALGAVSLLGDLSAPDELLSDPDISGIFLYEEDPFHYLNENLVKNALDKKEFIALCDILPYRAMDFAHLTIPSASFAEKNGTVISGDGKVRMVKRACRGTSVGQAMLPRLLHRLGGKVYCEEGDIKSDLRDCGLFEGNGGGEELLVAEPDKARFIVKPRETKGNVSPALGTERPFRLILRDIFANHHLTDKEIYGMGIAQVQKDMVFISPEDAAELHFSDEEVLHIESDNGFVTSTAAVKKGIKKGVLECILFQKRSEMLALSVKPAKVIEVSVRKA